MLATSMKHSINAMLILDLKSAILDDSVFIALQWGGA